MARRRPALTNKIDSTGERGQTRGSDPTPETTTGPGIDRRVPCPRHASLTRSATLAEPAHVALGAPLGHLELAPTIRARADERLVRVERLERHLRLRTARRRRDDRLSRHGLHGGGR